MTLFLQRFKKYIYHYYLALFNYGIYQHSINFFQNYYVSNEREIHFKFPYETKPGTSLSVFTRIEDQDASQSMPLRVTVRYDQGLTSWKIPYAVKSENSSNISLLNEIERSLCLLEENTNVHNSTGTVVISTSNPQNISFHIQIRKKSNYVTVNETKSVENVKIGSPVYYYVNLTGISAGYLHISVNSSDEYCGLISVHPLRCPFPDFNEVVFNREGVSIGGWQTISNFADFPIYAEDFTKGMIIKFDTLSSGEKCGKEYNQNIRDIKKSYRLTILPLKSNKEIFVEVLVTIVIILVVSFILIGLSIFHLYRQRNNKIGAEKNNDEVDGRQQQQQNPEAQQPNHIKYLSQLCQNEAHNQSELRKFYKLVYEQNELYFWLVILIGIFYSVPALQLVLRYQTTLRKTGDNDLCYYNFKCSFPLGKVHDFNHIISNIGYMAFGISFFIIVKCKKNLHLKEMNEKKVEHHLPAIPTSHINYNSKGIPQHYGIFYALGYALFAEGVLSACYHVCPTKENFQFDTTFMYVIAVLCFVKIYQFRHPDVTSNAYKIFAGISVVILFEVTGIFFANTQFWIILMILYVFFIMMLSTILYRAHKWKRPWQQLTLFYFVSIRILF